LFSTNYDHEAEMYGGGADIMSLYYAKTLVELLGEDWNHHSSIYDLTDYSTNLYAFRKRVDREPEKQFLVLVDFHH